MPGQEVSQGSYLGVASGRLLVTIAQPNYEIAFQECASVNPKKPNKAHSTSSSDNLLSMTGRYFNLVG